MLEGLQTRPLVGPPHWESAVQPVQMPMVDVPEEQDWPAGQALPPEPRQPGWQSLEVLQTRPLVAGPQSVSTVQLGFTVPPVSLQGMATVRSGPLQAGSTWFCTMGVQVPGVAQTTPQAVGMSATQVASQAPVVWLQQLGWSAHTEATHPVATPVSQLEGELARAAPVMQGSWMQVTGGVGQVAPHRSCTSWVQATVSGPGYVAGELHASAALVGHGLGWQAL
jgi:hypothetical protein